VQASQAHSKRHRENTNLTGSLESARMCFLLPEGGWAARWLYSCGAVINVSSDCVYNMVNVASRFPSRFMLNLNRTTIQLYWGLDW